MLHRIYSIFTFCALFAATSWAQTQNMALTEAVNYAYENNVSIRNAQIAIADAEQQINERLAVGLPQLNGEVSYQRYLKVPISVLPEAFVAASRDPITGELPDGFSREVSFLLKNQFSAGLTMNALVFDGSYFTAVKASRAFREYVVDQLDVAKQNVRNQATQAYLPALLVSENLIIIDKNLASLQALRRETNALYEEGFVEQLDVDRLDLSISNLETERENLVRQREVALNALKFAIGYPVDQPLEISDNIDQLLLETDDGLLTENIIYQNRAEYKVFEQAMELSNLNVEVNRRGYLPSLAAFGSYSYAYQGNNSEDGFWAPTSAIGLSLRVPIFDGFARKANIERARLQLQSTINEQTLLKQSIDLEVSNARTLYINAKERLTSQKRNVALAERIYNTTQIKYREGVGSSIELTQAEQSLFQTQQNYTQAVFDLLNAQVALKTALGLETVGR